MGLTSVGKPQLQESESEIFERQAITSKYFALLVAFLQKLSRVVGIMALTWATAVLLGGFVSNLITWDFYLVSTLLLLQSLRLFLTEMFAKTISWIRFREHQDPRKFQFTDRQPHLQNRLSRVGSIFGAVLAAICMIGTAIRLQGKSSHPFYSKDGGNQNMSKDGDNQNMNLVRSIMIFYMLVLINSAIAVLSFLLHEIAFQQIQRISSASCDNSLATFYNSIYKTAIDDSMSKAEDVQLLEFGFEKIAGELKRNIRHQRVRTLNSRMLKFMYSDHGVAMACAQMKSEDLWKLTAAANLPGFWAKENKIETHQDLFYRLRRRMYGAANDAIGALDSVTSLARYWSETNYRHSDLHPFLHRNPFDRGNIVDTIVDLILEPFRCKVLFRLRALEACCRDSRVRDHLYQQSAPCFGTGISDKDITTQIQEYLFTNLGHSASNSVRSAGQRVSEGTYESTQLAKLCMKLAVLLESGERVRTTSKIYSAKALLSLLRHGNTLLNEATMTWLSKLIQDRITVVSAVIDTVYFVRDDIAAAEEVRCWVGLPPLEWSSLRVIEPADEGGPFIPAHEIEAFVSEVRSRTKESMNPYHTVLDVGTV
ncbi:hypothetical protein KP509_16G021600 [Ceratopteris richardii]|nr:hypothetical protein KP509_16G021600 [Ceratopteris richardii]